MNGIISWVGGRERLCTPHILAAVNDPLNILKEIIAPEVLRKFHKNDALPIRLPVYARDVSIILGNLSTKNVLTINTRAGRISISQFYQE